MEEKMKKQKKGKTEKPAAAADDVQDSEVNTLQNLESEAVAESQVQEQTTQINHEETRN